MAYLTLSPWPTEGAATASGSPAAIDAVGFTRIELRVIALAERADAASELSRESRWGRFLHWAFGVTLSRPLANPRLESLRRFASLARHHPADVGEADVRELVGAGFSPGQAYGLLGYFAAAPKHRRLAEFA
jgi:hypothetical protein